MAQLPYWEGNSPPYLVTIFPSLFLTGFSSLLDCPCPVYTPKSSWACPLHCGMMKLRTTESSLEVPEAEALGLLQGHLCPTCTHAPFPEMDQGWSGWGSEPVACGLQGLWISGLLDCVWLVPQAPGRRNSSFPMGTTLVFPTTLPMPSYPPGIVISGLLGSQWNSSYL